MAEDEVVDEPFHPLTDMEVYESRQKYGENKLNIKEEFWLWTLGKLFLEPMSIMLEVSMIISGSAEDWPDFWIITTMLFVNCFLGFFEEMKAKSAVTALKNKMVNTVDVYRMTNEGQEGQKPRKMHIPKDPKELVVGDIIHVRGGDAIPADCSWAGGEEILVDTAALTGESAPVKFMKGGPKVPDPEKGGDAMMLKPILCGCCVKGSPGTYLRVEKVGEETENGKASMAIANDSKKQVSAFEEKIMNVVMYLIIVTILDVIVVITVQCELRGKVFMEEIVDCLSLLIASVPVALPMVIQITMALGASTMAEQKAIVTSFPALQDIAAMTVLCSDKTGTLTTADITVQFQAVHTYNGFSVEEVMDFAAVACGESTEDPIDKATKKAYKDNIKNPEQTLAKWTVTKIAGFTPIVKRFVAYAKHPDYGEMKLSKGLLDKILDTGDDGGDMWICEDLAKLEPEIKQVDAEFSKNGFKTVGVAAGKLVNGKWKMQFAGILPMIDPPRKDTKDVIAALAKNGIKTRMITGDHKNIAITTAHQIGIPTNIKANTELRDLDYATATEDELEHQEEERSCFAACDVEQGLDEFKASSKATELILNSGGFAQVMPNDKLVIVKTFQHGLPGDPRNPPRIVGMTGDGVNDAPALKAANVGIAVKGATAAAQQAADILLTDDGLMPIHTAVMESRRIYARLKSYVLYRVAATFQIVLVLSVLIFVWDQEIKAFYVILLALLNDITMLTVAYDNARVDPKPVKPSVFSIVATSAVVGIVMAISSILFYWLGTDPAIYFLNSNFESHVDDDTKSEYTQAVMYVQICLGIELLIFNCREPADWFFSSMPCWMLLSSVIFAEALIILCAGYGFIIYPIAWNDIWLIFGYNIGWFVVTDIIKVITASLTADMFDTDPPTLHDFDGGGPAGTITDRLCLPKRGVWKSFGEELVGWADTRAPPIRNCCANKGRRASTMDDI